MTYIVLMNGFKKRGTKEGFQCLLYPPLGVLMMRVEFEFNRARVESLTFRVELELELSLLEPSSTRLVNISSRARARVELTRVEF